MKKNIIIIVITALFLSSVSVTAKNKFEKVTEKEGVIFYNKWKRSVFFKKDSPLALILKIKNTNEYPVKVTFKVNYHWQMELKASSPEQDLDVKPQKSLVRNFKKQGFDNFSFSNEEIKSEDFNFELAKISIENLPEK